MKLAKSISRGAWALAALAVAAAPPAGAEDGTASAAETLTLKGGEEGTVFDDLTIRGEDRIRIEFERPVLTLDLAPREAAGLNWGDPSDVLESSGIDLVGPLPAESADDPCRFLGMPWLEQFRSDAVARFRPELKDVDRWRLVIADSRADTVAVFGGDDEPPAEIVWNGRTLDGTPMLPGVTCSYVLEAWDEAGNRRNFVGPGFVLPAYRVTSEEGTTLMFAVGALPAEVAGPIASPPPTLLEVASWVNQAPAAAPVEVKVTASTFDEARAVGESLVAALQSRVLGDPARLRASSEVRSDAPAGGAVAVIVGS